MFRSRAPRIPVPLLIVVICLCFSQAAVGQTGSLMGVLRERPADRLLELTLTDGQFIRGYPITVHNDTLHLRRDRNGGPVRALFLADIIRVREWHSSTARGAGWGAGTGAVILGGFGTLLGLYVAGGNPNTHSDLGPVVGLTLVGAATGALAGGLVGGGVGALVNSWHQVWPPDGAAPLPDLPVDSENTRLGLFAGAGRTLLDDYEVTRFVGRISLHKTLSEKVSLGPEIGYHHFGGHIVTHGPGSVEVSSKDNLLLFALGTNLHWDGPSLAPFVTVGVGWFLSNNTYVGGHAGGGLRWQAGRGTDLELDLRYHFSFTDVDDDGVDRFWTLGLGFGFGI